MGSATIASTRNLKRHFVTASQYANGSPTMNRISVVREASRTLSQIASRSMVHYSNSYPDDRCSSLCGGQHRWPPTEYIARPRHRDHHEAAADCCLVAQSSESKVLIFLVNRASHAQFTASI